MVSSGLHQQRGKRKHIAYNLSCILLHEPVISGMIYYKCIAIRYERGAVFHLQQSIKNRLPNYISIVLAVNGKKGNPFPDSSLLLMSIMVFSRL